MNPTPEVILISDTRILEVAIEENGESLVDLRSYPEILIDNRKSEDSQSFYLARRSIAERLRAATKNLPKGIRFLVIEAHRPLELQKQYFGQYSEELKTDHPNWDEKRIFDEASKYIAPPEIVPPHSTGGAIDLTLTDKDGKELDMGTLVNGDPEKTVNTCFTNAENISDIAKRNRKILITALSEAGFVNYPTEWWHWSYGDRYWGYHTNQNALFGSVSK
jgi:D-alanyl-D-alanine dipeptidase